MDTDQNGKRARIFTEYELLVLKVFYAGQPARTIRREYHCDPWALVRIHRNLDKELYRQISELVSLEPVEVVVYPPPAPPAPPAPLPIYDWPPRDLGSQLRAERARVKVLREALEEIIEANEQTPVKTYQRMEDIARQALAITEDDPDDDFTRGAHDL